MLTSTGNHPATTIGGLEDNTLADGLFHALTFVAALIGLTLLWAAVRKGAALAGRHLVGLMLAGWGAFNLVEGIVDHQILTVHHVNPDHVMLWDVLPRTTARGLSDLDVLSRHRLLAIPRLPSPRHTEVRPG